MTSMPMNRRAFSLVELSIVLVILGLLVGGVLAGQSLIRASELRSVAVEFNRWMTATTAFRDKYYYLPGDLPNATQFWGVADAVACALTTTNDARTCSGDGNGTMESNSGGKIGNEFYRYWQHLANAGMIEGNYSGIRYYVATDGAEATQADNTQAGYNSPKPKLSNASWTLDGTTSSPLSNTFDNYNTSFGKNAFVFGLNYGWGPSVLPILTPAEAWGIDKKIDDSRPGLGKVLSQYNANCSTGSANSGDITNGYYNLTYSSASCYLVFPNVF